MASINAGPITGSELIVANQDGKRVLLTRLQLASLIALTAAISPRAYASLTEKTGDENFQMLQGSTRVEFNSADLTTYLAASGVPDYVLPAMQPGPFSGRERVLIRQGQALAAIDLQQLLYVRGLGGSLGGVGSGPVTLSVLSLSAPTATTGVLWSATINGKTGGSTITATSSDGTTVSVSGAAASATFSAAGSPTITLVETLAGAVGSPKTTTVTLTVAVPSTAPLTVLFVGSSTPQKYFDTGAGPSNSNVTASADGVTFAALGTVGAGATNLGNALANATGRPIRFIKKGSNGTLLADWEAASSTQRAGAVNAAIAAGGVDMIVSIVGFNDAYQTGGTIVSQAAHETKLRSFYSRLRTEIGQPNVPIIVGISQIYTGTDPVTDIQFTWLHAAELNVSADTNNYFGAHAYDLAQLSDGIHQTGASYILHAARLNANMLSVLGIGTLRRGPSVTAAAAVYTTQTRVTIAHDGGTDFTPTTALTGWEVSFDSFSTTTTVTSVAREDATHLIITHSASGGIAPSVRAFAGHAPIVTAVLKDNASPSLPLNPTKSSVTAASGTNTVAPGSTAPAAPVITVTPSNAQNTIAWVDGSDGGSAITSHKLYRGTSSGFTPGAGNLLATISAASPYVDGTLTNGTAYYYKLSAVNSIGEGAFSNEGTGTPAAGTGFTDTFDYANNSTLATNGWTALSGTFTVFNSEAYGSVVGNTTAPYTPAGTDYTVSAPFDYVTAPTGSANTLLLLHVQDDNNYIYAGYTKAANLWEIGKKVAGTNTALTSGITSPTPVTGNILNVSASVSVSGGVASVVLKVDGTQVGPTVTVSDAALLPKGKPGIRQSGGAATQTGGVHLQSFTVTEP